MAMKVKEHYCKCGKKFTGVIIKKYCSEDCKKKYNSEYTRERKLNFLMHGEGDWRPSIHKIKPVDYDNLIKNGCNICGYKLTINIHHIDSNRQNGNLNNLIVLCPNHHALITRRMFSLNELSMMKQSNRTINISEERVVVQQRVF